MKKISLITNKYLRLKNLNIKSDDELDFVLRYENALSGLNFYERDFFMDSYLKANEDDWWTKYYSRSTYYRINKAVSDKFAILFNT